MIPIDKEREQLYLKQKGKFLDISFGNGLIEITVLQDVKEFYEDGKAMQTLLYEKKYDMKDSSLILSAKINGERIETVEVDLDRFVVVQSRGIHNTSSEYHHHIIELVKRNMILIRLRALEGEQ